MYKHILIPTDGSDISMAAIEGGIALAKALQARVTGVHVMPQHLGRLYGDMAWVDEGRDLQMRQNASLYLDRMAEAAKRADVKFESVLTSDDLAWQGILRIANEKRCDLIVMAAHGRRGVAAVVLGSETNRVLVHSKIPVLVHR